MLKRFGFLAGPLPLSTVNPTLRGDRLFNKNTGGRVIYSLPIDAKKHQHVQICTQNYKKNFTGTPY